MPKGTVVVVMAQYANVCSYGASTPLLFLFRSSKLPGKPDAQGFCWGTHFQLRWSFMLVES